MSGDDFETPSGRVWGELRRLHHRWGTPTLDASMFLFVTLSFILFVVVATNSQVSRFEQIKDGLS